MLTLAAYKARTIVPSEDVEALVCLRKDRVNADATADQATGETRIGEIAETGTASLITLTPMDVLVAHDTNYATISVYKRTDGGARVLVASRTTRVTSPGSGDWAAEVPFALTIATGAVTAGDVITYAITKSGSGVVVPGFAIALKPSTTKIDKRIAVRSSEILARLAKRYNRKTIADAPPEIVLGWLEALVTLDCFLVRGFNPGSKQDEQIIARAEKASADLKEAADAKDGLFDLPLIDNEDATAISKGAPLAYTEASPYVGFDVQAERGRAEDNAGSGTFQ